jgi:hypothetical protein
MGQAIHNVVQKAYDFDDINVTMISDKYKLKGKADAVKYPILYEFKTVDEAKFQSFNIEHVKQAYVYAQLSKEVLGKEIKIVCLVYFFRDNIRKTPFCYDFVFDDKAEKIAKDLIIKSLIVRNAIDSKVVPSTNGASEEECKWCQFKNYCINEKDFTPDEVLLNFRKRETVSSVISEEIKYKPIKSTFQI